MQKETDLYRDTLVRYLGKYTKQCVKEKEIRKCVFIRLGYANEVGESFRHLVSSKVVTASYVVATGYAVADTIDKTHKDYNQRASVKSAAITAADVFLWQMLASVSIPGFTINR